MAEFAYFTIAPRTFKAKPRKVYVNIDAAGKKEFESGTSYAIATNEKYLKHLQDTGVEVRFLENPLSTKKSVTFAITCEGACTGITPDATSTDSTAGVAGSTAQVETATLVGTTTAAGYAKITVTSAQFPAGQNPRVVNVRLATGVAPAAYGETVRAALTADPVISAYFTVSGSTDSVVLTSKAKLANDTTLNIAVDNGADPATAVATSSCTYEMWNTDGFTIAPKDATTNKHVFEVPEGQYQYKVTRTGWEPIIGRANILGSNVTETRVMRAIR